MSQGRRTAPLPDDWPAIRQRILDRDGHRCRWIENSARCAAPATEVDHITPTAWGGTDEDSNLQSLCQPHHLHKTAVEANPASRRRRTQEPHPGHIGG